MKSERIFVGPIYHNEEFVDNTILVQARNGKYLELYQTKNFLLRLALEFSLLQDSSFIGNSNTAKRYTKSEELRPYISTKTQVSLKRARMIHNKKKKD